MSQTHQAGQCNFCATFHVSLRRRVFNTLRESLNTLQYQVWHSSTEFPHFGGKEQRTRLKLTALLNSSNFGKTHLKFNKNCYWGSFHSINTDLFLCLEKWLFLTLFPLQVHGGVQANCNNIREIFGKYPGNIALVAFFNNGLAAFRTETIFYNLFFWKIDMEIEISSIVNILWIASPRKINLSQQMLLHESITQMS